MKTLHLTILTLIFISSNSYPQWSTNPYENLQVVEHGGNIKVVSDGDGGVVITFNNFDYDIVTSYMQIVDRYGYLKWIEPKILAESPGQKNYGVGLFSGGDENYIFGYISGYTYIDSNLTQYSFFDPYVQKIDTNGIRLWGEYGIKLNPNSPSQRVSMFLCSDEEKGLYAFWVISPNGYPGYDSLFIQHISKNGEKLWGENGIFIDDSIIDVLDAWIVSDDSGGIFVQYYKQTNVYFIKNFDSTGNLNWTLSLPINFSRAIKDSNGGIIISGVVDSYPTRKLIINRISPQGEKLWGDGVIVDDSVNNSLRYPSEIFLNDDSTVSVFWDTEWWPNDELFLQRYTLGGEQIWGEPIKVSDYSSPKGRAGIIKSDDNANIIVWGETRDSSAIYAQKIDILGNKLWVDSDIMIMSHSPYDETKVITDGNAGAIIVWRIDPPWGGIYAQQISKNGNLGELIVSVKEENNNINPESFYLAQNYPNPFNPTTTIKYDLPFASEVSVAIYDILGRKVKELVNTKQQAGRYEVQFNAYNLASGIYIYQLIAEKFIRSKKMILLK